MKIATLSGTHGLPEQIIGVLHEAGYDSLYPPQEEAVRAGVLEGENLVLAVPTAAGKTLVAEMCMLKRILDGNGRCLYIVPLRALASEKCEDFRKKYGGLGVSVGLATGEYDAPSKQLAGYDILIATSEKVDSLLRLRAGWLAEALAVAVLDEIHYIHDASRGPTLEIVAARLRQVNPKLQILALSATISNGEELAGWLGASLVSSDWRPVPLLEGIYCENKIYYSDFTTRNLVGSSAEPLEALVSDTIREGGQVLVFVNSRRSTRAVARRVAPQVRKTLSAREKGALAALASEAGHVLTEPTHLCRELEETMRSGIAFHHAGLHRTQRKLIEDAFRDNRIKAICATPTLAAGVNLPARRVVVRDWRRYESGRGLKPIPVFEYKQFAGRAGRPGYDTLGESILIARREKDRDLLLDKYIMASVEPLRSQLGSGGALASHILAAIAAGYAGSLKEITDFLSLTFFAHQEDLSYLDLVLRNVIDFLVDEEMIICEGSDQPGYELTEVTQLYPTAFGGLVSRLYLDPHSGTIIRDGLRALGGRAPALNVLLHLVCCCPDMASLNLGKAVKQELSEEAIRRRDTFVVPCPEIEDEPQWSRFLAALLTAHMLEEWIGEKTEEFICERFGVGPGDIRRFVDSAEWLVYSAWRFAELFEIDRAAPALKELRRRLLYGVRKELLDLVSLKGIGRVRARSLFSNGYRTLADMGRVSVKKLSAVPAIGPKIAASIKKQLK